ncbi:MAG: CusA/CzcA family heavy metal efflux RND transporter [Elusimicrobiota bacterium]
MLEKIVEFSAKNKFLVILLTLVMMAFAVYAIRNIPLDAIPDLSDTQVIVYSRWDRSPDIVEDQVTYPIVSSLLGMPKVKAVRGFSDFGFSYVYVIFQDGTDIYWARSRVLEYLSKTLPRLPSGVTTELGPDATGVGWVYQYALVDKSGKSSPSELRSLQDWFLKYQLQSVPGVAEVAAVGGYQKQYQIVVNPSLLTGYNVSIFDVIDAVRKNNNDVGGRMIELAGTEYMIRGRGYAKTMEDIEGIGLGKSVDGTQLTIRNVATVQIGPDIRRGIADLDGQGDTVGGIIIMRHGENALNVITRVKSKIKELLPSLPPGVTIVSTYDRSELILRAIDTLKHQLVEEMIIVSIVILVFLWHFPSAIVPIITIPISVFLTFIPLFGLKLTTNIMSLSGIAISIGILVDGAIIEVENAYKRMQEWLDNGRKGDFHEVRIQAMKEVVPSVFFSLLVIAVSFLPVFTLLDQEGRLFKPLAVSKTLAMAIAAILAITLDPAIRLMFTRVDPVNFKPVWFSNIFNAFIVGKYHAEEHHPVSAMLQKVYEPVCRWALKNRIMVVLVAAILVILTIPVYIRLGTEFMPPLNEGAILYMPTTLPGISVTEASKLLQTQDQILKSFPEVERVFGKAGRADTSTDPAPFSMMETTVVLKPENKWRKLKRWYTWIPNPVRQVFTPFWPEHITWDELVNEMDSKMKFPGVTNAWTMPIKARIDMLTTGVRTPVGIKIFGSDSSIIESIGADIESAIKTVPGTRSVFAERVTGGYFIDFVINREQAARYNLSIDDIETVIMTAIGGENVTTTIEGRARYSVNIRYPRELRDNLTQLQRVLVPTPDGIQVPLAQVADIKTVTGPAMIRNENGLLAGYVYVDLIGRDVGKYVEDAKKKVAATVKLPTGYSLNWSGQYENIVRVNQRLKVVVPITLFLIFLLLYMNTKSWVKTGIVLLAVPFSLIGAVWLLFILGYNISIAVWVGMIALMGLDAETGVFMLLFLDMAYQDAVKNDRMNNTADLTNAVIHGAVRRIRPKMMTVTAIFVGLLPIMWSTGTGADVMKRIAAPMIGGVFTSFALELLVYPVVYSLWKQKTLKKHYSFDLV